MFLKNKIILIFIFVFCSIVSVFSFDFTISKDFDLIEDSKASVHYIRIYALMENTAIEIVNSSDSASETIYTPGDFIEIQLQAGDTIESDKPVVVLKYKPSDCMITTNLMLTTSKYFLSDCDYFLIASKEDASSITVDIDNDGISETRNVNAGYALLGKVGAGKDIICDKDVLIFSLDSSSNELSGVYLLTPGSSNYVSLYSETFVKTIGD